MNWLTTLAFAVLLLSIQYNASQSASPTLSKSPWADPVAASTFMDCLIEKIIESDVFPQQEKEDLKSIMDTLMSAISGANARGKSSGAQLQAINMAIASSLAEIVVQDDASNPTRIAEKTEDLGGGLEQCFESVMGTIDRKFINEINDLISMFAKEAASESKEAEDQEDQSSDEESDEQPTPSDDEDQVPESAPNDDEPEVSEPEPNGDESEDSQSPPEPNSEIPNEPPRSGLRNRIPQQTVRTPIYPNRSTSSSYQTSQSAANTYQSSQTFQGSSQTANGYGGAYRGPQFSDLTPINSGPQVPQPVPIGAGPQALQPATGRIWRTGNEMTDESTRKTFLRNGVPQQTVPTAAFPRRLSSSSFETTSQSAENAYQSSQTFQDSSQTADRYGGTYSGPQFSDPTPIDLGPQVPQAASENSKVENELEDASTRRTVFRNRVRQQNIPAAVYPNRLPSPSFQTISQSADNTYQSSQTFQGSSQTADDYRGPYSGPQMVQPTPFGVRDQDSEPDPNAFGPQVSQPSSGRIWRVGNEMADTSKQRPIFRSGVPQQTIPTAVYPDRSSSSSFQSTGQSAANTYQSSQTFRGSSQTADEYGRTNFPPEYFEPPPIAAGPQVSKPAPVIPRPQVTQPAPIIPRPQVRQPPIVPRPQVTQPAPIIPRPQVAQPAPIIPRPQVTQPAPIIPRPQVTQPASKQRPILRSGVRQKTIPAAVYPNRSSSSSFQTTSQSSAKTSQSSQTFQRSSQRTGGYGKSNLRPELFEPPPITARPPVSKPAPIDVQPQVSQSVPGFTREANKLADTTTRRTVLRNGVSQQTVPKAVYPNRPSSFKTVSQSSDNTYQSRKTSKSSSQASSGYSGTYRGPKYSEPKPIGVKPQIPQPPPIGARPQIPQSPPIGVRPQIPQSPPIDVRPQIPQSPPIGVGPRVTQDTQELEDTSTRRTILRNRIPQQTVPTAVYPNRSSFQTTSQSAANTYQSSQTVQSSSQTTDEYQRRYRGPQFFEPTPTDVAPQVLQAAPELVNEPGDASKQRSIFRSSVPNRSSSSSFKSSQSAANTYQSSQTFQRSSQGYGRAYSGPQVPQPIPIGVPPQIPLPEPDNEPQFLQSAPALAPLPDDQDTPDETSCTAPLPELSVLPTLNSPNGLKSDSAVARVNQMIPSVLNAISPSGVDANALARSLQESVSNLRRSGMSPSDAKLEVLLELIAGLLQIVSNADIFEINTTTASAVTDAAAKCFELALA